MARKDPKKSEPPKKPRAKGPFDFNRDGKVSLGEQWIAYQIFLECTKEEKPQDDIFCFRRPCYPIYDDDDIYDDYDDDCDDMDDDVVGDATAMGVADVSAMGVADIAAQEENKIDPKDYPNKRRYLAACTLSDEACGHSVNEQERARCQFILEQADTILAANYLSPSDGFLYAQAIKDHFVLPVFIPKEDAQRKRDFHQVLLTIARKDIPCSLEAWRWCLDQFMPYQQYDRRAASDMTGAVIDQFHRFPKGYLLLFLRAMDQDPKFAKTVVKTTDTVVSSVPVWIELAMEDGLRTAAFTLFQSALAMAGEDRRRVEALVEDLLLRLKNYREAASMEYFRDHMLPLIPEPLVSEGKFAAWKADIAEYLSEVASLQTNGAGCSARSGGDIKRSGL